MIKRPFLGVFAAIFNAIKIPNNNPPKKSIYSTHKEYNESYYSIRTKQTDNMLKQMTGKSKAECRKIAKKYR